MRQCFAKDRTEAAARHRRGGVGNGALVPQHEHHAWGALPMLRRVLARQAVLFRRDPTLTRARLIQSTVIGLLIGGLWYQLSASYQDSRCVPPCQESRTDHACR